MRKGFLSYRRDDSSFITGMLYEELQKDHAFGPNSIFMDINTIPSGVEFQIVIEETISECEFAMVVIGKSWATIKNPDGDLRLFDENDFVRLEIEAALKRGIPVTPILVDGATMPKLDQLPISLQPLLKRHAHVLPTRSRDFVQAVSELVNGIKAALEYLNKPTKSAVPSTPGAPVTPIETEVTESGAYTKPVAGEEQQNDEAATSDSSKCNPDSLDTVVTTTDSTNISDEHSDTPLDTPVGQSPKSTPIIILPPPAPPSSAQDILRIKSTKKNEPILVAKRVTTEPQTILPKTRLLLDIPLEDLPSRRRKVRRSNWWVRTEKGMILGPYQTVEVLKLLDTGRIKEFDEVSSDNKRWHTLGQVKEFEMKSGGTHRQHRLVHPSVWWVIGIGLFMAAVFLIFVVFNRS